MFVTLSQGVYYVTVQVSNAKVSWDRLILSKTCYHVKNCLLINSRIKLAIIKKSHFQRQQNFCVAQEPLVFYHFALSHSKDRKDDCATKGG